MGMDWGHQFMVHSMQKFQVFQNLYIFIVNMETTLEQNKYSSAQLN